jgi:exopolysaccharide biosynthesis protein
MRRFFRRPFRYAICYSLLLLGFTAYVLLDAFVIPRAGIPAAAAAEISDSQQEQADGPQTSPVITDMSYEDENIKISIESVYEYDTWIYVADIQVSSAAYLKTAFAGDTYGRNFKDTTSDMAEDKGAIFAINGDYYGFRDTGFVLRNGVLYRDTARTSGEDLVIDSTGNFSIANESYDSAQQLAEDGAWQIFSFGPALIDDGEICVTSSSEVSQSKSSNPRTAIGQVSELHYIVIVSDGRTSESKGLSLLQLAQEFQARGCTVAYNLDGGGSSTMWFNGEIVNNPVGGRSNSSERSVSDIVYFGY